MGDLGVDESLMSEEFWHTLREAFKAERGERFDATLIFLQLLSMTAHRKELGRRKGKKETPTISMFFFTSAPFFLCPGRHELSKFVKRLTGCSAKQQTTPTRQTASLVFCKTSSLTELADFM